MGIAPLASSAELPGAYASTQSYGVNNGLEVEPEQVYMSRSGPGRPLSDMLALVFQVPVRPRRLLCNCKYFLLETQEMASISADWSEPVAKASLFCLKRDILRRPHQCHLELHPLWRR